MISLDGKKLFNKIKEELKVEVQFLNKNGLRSPHLAAILIGDNPASRTYINAKVKACNEIGFDSTVINFPSSIEQKELLMKINEINCNDDIDGLIVQLPLPDHLDEDVVTHNISYKKDVDGFHPVNIGRMVLGLPCFLPATPFGIVSLLKEYNIDTTGKKCLVIGRSHIVGTPISILMSRNNSFGNSTVTLAHSKTKNLKSLTLQSDIIIVALGKAHFLTNDMVKKSSIIIDVGIHRVPSSVTKSGYKLIGDVDFDKVKDKVAYISPVPGGVGPMTIASLLKNTLYSAKKVIYSSS